MNERRRWELGHVIPLVCIVAFVAAGLVWDHLAAVPSGLGLLYGLAWFALASGAAILTATIMGNQQEPKTVTALSVVAVLAAAAWVVWAVFLTTWPWRGAASLLLVAGLLVLAALANRSRPLAPPQQATATAPEQPAAPPRDPAAVSWEADLRGYGDLKTVSVEQVEHWDNGNGVRVCIDLNDATAGAVRNRLDDLAGKRKLDNHSAITMLPGAHRGKVVLDVLLTPAASTTLDDDFAERSINDPFTLMVSPRGDNLDVCLRQDGMVVGGDTGSGKTTLLRRIFLHLAQCTDALIWVVDLNGGGCALEFFEPHLDGEPEATRPIVDWVATTSEEAALLFYVAGEIARDRKMYDEAKRRKREANTDVLPVSDDLPAIIIVTDEGGEIMAEGSRVAERANENAARVVRIGRAEGARLVMSVLRGTQALLERDIKVNARNRACLHMTEDEEYEYVLGKRPSIVESMSVGDGYLCRAQDRYPIFARGLFADKALAYRASVECVGFRPWLDERAEQVAASVRAADFLGQGLFDKVENPHLVPAILDAEHRLAYENRWERLRFDRAIRDGQPIPERYANPAPFPKKPSSTTATASAGSGPAVVSSAGAALLEAAGMDGGSSYTVPASRRPDTTQPTTTKERIVRAVTDAYPEPLTRAQIAERLMEAGAGVHSDTLKGHLSNLVADGKLVRLDNGAGYTVKAA